MAYYDKSGTEISLNVWAVLFEDFDYKVIASDTGCQRRVSTVWVGLDQGFGRTKAPLIFESMVFTTGVDETSIDSMRYATEAEALEGHKRLCAGNTRILDRIVTSLEEDDEAVDDSGSSSTSEAAG